MQQSIYKFTNLFTKNLSYIFRRNNKKQLQTSIYNIAKGTSFSHFSLNIQKLSIKMLLSNNNNNNSILFIENIHFSWQIRHNFYDSIYSRLVRFVLSSGCTQTK